MRITKKQFFVYPAMMVLAMYATVLGLMVPQIQIAFGFSFTEVGFLSTLQSIGMAVSLILCFGVFSAFNAIKVSAIAIVVFSGLMVILGYNQNVVLLYFLFFLIGFFVNTIDALANTVISITAKTRTSFYLGMLHALWALAGVLGPFLAIALGGDYTMAFLWLGIIMAMAAVVYIFGLRAQIKMPMVQNKHHIGGLKKLWKLIRKKGMFKLVAINFFSCLTMNTYIFFISSYIKINNDGWLSGAIMLSSMFLGLLIGRLIFSKFVERIPILKTMAITNALAIVAFGLMLVTQSMALNAVFTALGSLLIGANFPALVIESHKIVPEDVSAASSLVYFGLVAALFVGPALIGRIGDAIGLPLALLVNAALLVPVVVLAAMLSKHLDSPKRSS